MELVSEGKPRNDDLSVTMSEAHFRSRRQLSPQRAVNLILCEQIKRLQKASKFAASLQSPPSPKAPSHSFLRPLHTKTSSLTKATSGPGPFLGVGFPSQGLADISRAGLSTSTVREVATPTSQSVCFDSPDVRRDLNKSFAVLRCLDETEKPLFVPQRSFMKDNTLHCSQLQWPAESRELSPARVSLPQIASKRRDWPAKGAGGALSKARPGKCTKDKGVKLSDNSFLASQFPGQTKKMRSTFPLF